MRGARARARACVCVCEGERGCARGKKFFIYFIYLIGFVCSLFFNITEIQYIS